MRDDQVHRQARAVLDFWLRETPPGKRFARDDAIDAEIRRRFQPLRDHLARTGAAGWWDSPETLLAAVIALDQFSRNLYRGAAEAFAGDPLARRLADAAIAAGWDSALDQTERQFLYMPFMHSEDMADQEISVALFEALGDEDSADFALEHRAVIARFGRFPGRNAALDREDTRLEREFLQRPQAF